MIKSHLEKLGCLYNLTKRDWNIEISQSLTEPTAPAAWIYPEDMSITRYLVVGNSIEEAIEKSVDLAYQELVLGNLIDPLCPYTNPDDQDYVNIIRDCIETKQSFPDTKTNQRKAYAKDHKTRIDYYNQQFPEDSSELVQTVLQKFEKSVLTAKQRASLSDVETAVEALESTPLFLNKRLSLEVRRCWINYIEKDESFSRESLEGLVRFFRKNRITLYPNIKISQRKNIRALWSNRENMFSKGKNDRSVTVEFFEDACQVAFYEKNKWSDIWHYPYDKVAEIVENFGFPIRGWL